MGRFFCLFLAHVLAWSAAGYLLGLLLSMGGYGSQNREATIGSFQAIGLVIGVFTGLCATSVQDEADSGDNRGLSRERGSDHLVITDSSERVMTDQDKDRLRMPLQ